MTWTTGSIPTELVLIEEGRTIHKMREAALVVSSGRDADALRTEIGRTAKLRHR